MTTVLPNLYHIWSATFALAGSQRQLVITHAGFSASVVTAPALNNAWRSQFVVSGTAKPFATGVLPSGLICISTNVLLRTGGLLYSDTNNANVVGTASTSIPPVNSAVLATKVTGVAGRQYRGRMFMPTTCAEANIGADGIIDTTTLATLQGRMDSAYNGLTAAGVLPFLLHSNGAITPTAVTSWKVEQLVGTMKRRLRR